MSTKLRLINQWGACPPDGYKYTDPVDGFFCHEWTFVDWVEKQKAHLRGNNREIPIDLEAQMENQLCQTLDPGWCMYDDPARPRVNLQLTWDDVKGSLPMFKQWLVEGRQKVDPAEAHRRAEICTRCYMNVHVGGCSTCQKLVAEVVGARATALDYALKSCAVCRCVLRAKVHLPLQLLLDNEDEHLQSVYPEHCWLKRTGSNYAREPQQRSVDVPA